MFDRTQWITALIDLTAAGNLVATRKPEGFTRSRATRELALRHTGDRRYPRRMSWPFVGRSEQISLITTALGSPPAGPIVLTGEGGIGRSTVLTRVIRQSTVDRHVVRVVPMGAEPFAALRPFLPSLPDAPVDARVAAAAEELARLGGAAPLILVADDAHLADHATMLVLRTLHRQGRAQLIITRPGELVQSPLPDPTECLRYERDAVTVRLPPLDRAEVAEVLAHAIDARVHPATVAALHTASGGNPRALRELVVGGRLLDCLAERPGGWRLREADQHLPAPLLGGDADRLVAATAHAWYELELDEAEELCLLAAWRGAGDRVRSIWATVLLLHGHPAQCLRVLDTIPDVTPHLVLVRAAALALGLHQPAAASEYLLGVANTVPGLRDRAPAFRAWLLAIAGHRVDVPPANGDREAAVFCGAARATLALAGGRAAEAVGHLRRALAAVEGCRADMPWLPPFLIACLIDALLLAGRINEAMETAAEFRPGKQISVVIAALASQTMAALTVRATTEGMTSE